MARMHYTPEIKMSVAQIVLDHNGDEQYVAALLGLNGSTVHNWHKKFGPYLSAHESMEEAIRAATLDGKFGKALRPKRLLKGDLNKRVAVALNLKGKEPKQSDLAVK